jgi:L-2-hydroxycarboxylate dehydrogenase (NAD+)
VAGRIEPGVAGSTVVESVRAAELCAALLRRHGAGAEAAELQTGLLVEADLRGRPSHGLQRLPVLLARIDGGLIVPDAVPHSAWEADSFLAVDGRHGFGVVAVRAAIDQLVERARGAGVVAAGIRQGSHIGMLAPHLEEICRHGMVGMMMTTSEALVRPAGGRTALLGTNPIGICVPADPDPFVLDMSTAAISAGEVIARGQRGEALPPDRCVDVDGNPTIDPELARAGAISPFGGGKGYGLSLAIELLVALLSGTAVGTEVLGTLDTEFPATKGDLIVVFDPAAAGLSAPAPHLSAYLEDLRRAPVAPGVEEILVPGDRMRAERRRRSREGISYPVALWEGLLEREAAGGVDGRG